MFILSDFEIKSGLGCKFMKGRDLGYWGMEASAFFRLRWKSLMHIKLRWRNTIVFCRYNHHIFYAFLLPGNYK